MTDLTTLTPAEVDTVLAPLWGQKWQYMNWLYDLTERITDIENDLAAGRRPRRFGRLDELVEQADKYRAKVTELRELAAPYEAEFTRRGGWNRYYLVTNMNGHVHRGTDCTTCYPTTQYQWLIDLADCDEKAMVADYGELACSVCFPDAPVYKGYGDGTSAMARLSAAEKQARADAKAERAAKKAAKTLNTPVRVKNRPGDRTELIETVYAAKAWIKGQIDMQSWGYGLDPGLVAEGTEVLRRALAEKGIDVDPMIVKWTKAATK